MTSVDVVGGDPEIGRDSADVEVEETSVRAEEIRDDVDEITPGRGRGAPR